MDTFLKINKWEYQVHGYKVNIKNTKSREKWNLNKIKILSQIPNNLELALKILYKSSILEITN